MIERTEECSKGISEKSVHKENGNFVPSDLLDFLSEDEMKGDMDLSDFECLNSLDLELDISLRGEPLVLPNKHLFLLCNDVFCLVQVCQTSRVLAGCS